jgi:UDP-N-acetylmuramate dehydrogenase
MKALTSEQIVMLSEQIPGVLRDEPMSKHTNFRIGGPARLYVAAASAEGLVIQSALRGLVVDGERVTAESGVITALAARKAADAGLAGFEWAIGVPGTIGGAVYGNAGCYGGEMKDVIETVDAYRIADKQRVMYSNADCGFAYRESKFKHDRHLILGCTIKLSVGDAAASKKRMQEIVETRKEKQPLEMSSAGCAFKNFEFSDPSQIATLRSKVDVPEAMIAKGVISAGWAVDQAGARGMKIGGVAVSDKHGNFLVNVGGGTAKDVIMMISAVKTKVRDELGILLENEVQLLGFE